MTNQLPQTYRPRFIGAMLNDDHGDLLVRKALLQHMRAARETGVLRTALEHSMVYVDLCEALVPAVWDADDPATTNAYNVQDVATTIMQAISTHPGFPDSGGYLMYLLSPADGALIVETAKGLTFDELQDVYDSESDAYATVLGALSEAVTIDVVPDDTFVALVQGGRLNMPETALTYGKDTGQFAVTRNSLKAYGLRIPRHTHFTDNNDVVLSIQYPKGVDGVTVTVKSSRDDVPDADQPGENKSEQFTVRLRKGKNTTAIALTMHDLKYHEWTFSVQIKAPKATA